MRGPDEASRAQPATPSLRDDPRRAGGARHCRPRHRRAGRAGPGRNPSSSTTAAVVQVSTPPRSSTYGAGRRWLTRGGYHESHRHRYRQDQRPRTPRLAHQYPHAAAHDQRSRYRQPAPFGITWSGFTGAGRRRLRSIAGPWRAGPCLPEPEAGLAFPWASRGLLCGLSPRRSA